MANLSVEEHTRLVEVVATAAGTDPARARYLVDTAIRVHESVMAKDDPIEAIQVLALCLHMFGASISPAYSARHNLPTIPDPDPEKLKAIRDHVEGGVMYLGDEDEDDPALD